MNGTKQRGKIEPK